MNTVNKQLVNPLMVIVITSDEESKENTHRLKKRCKHRRKKLDHAKKGKLKISQKVELSKDKFSYVINVNAEISDVKNHERKISDKKQIKYQTHNKKQYKLDNIKCPKTSKEVVKKCKDKIVPECLRRRCVALIRCKARNCQAKKAKKELIFNQESLRKKYKDELRKSKCNHHRKPSSCKIPSKPDVLSPISSLSCKDVAIDSEDVTQKSVISYDDVSLDSTPFTSHKLDMLIKRTKQRERKMQEKITNSRQDTVHRTPHVESEDESLTLSSSSKDTLIQERKQDDKILYSPLKNHLYFSDNVGYKTKYQPYNKKYSNKRHESQNNTSIHSKYNISKRYSIESKKKIETYIPNSLQGVKITKNFMQDKSNYRKCFMNPEYPTSSAYVRNYPQSVFNYPLNFNVTSENTSYRYPESYSNERYLYYYTTTQYGHIDYKCAPVPNKVDYLINNNNNPYSNLNNYPAELHQAPMSGSIHYDNSTILSHFREHSVNHSFFSSNSVKVDSYIIGSHENNYSYYDPVKFESCSTGYNPNYLIN